MSLAPQDIEAIAERVVELLGERDRWFPREGLVDADAVAGLLATSRDWVYAHQRDLGVVRLDPAASRSALRFDAAVVRAYLRDRRVDAPAPQRKTGPKRNSRNVDLLPLRGERAA